MLDCNKNIYELFIIIECKGVDLHDVERRCIRNA